MNKKKQRENKMKTFDEFYNKIKKIRRKERKETFLPIPMGRGASNAPQMCLKCASNAP